MTSDPDHLAQQRRAAAPPDRPGERWSGEQDCIDVGPNDVSELRRFDDGDYEGLGLLSRLKARVHLMVTSYAPDGDHPRASGLGVVSDPEQAIVLTRLG